MATRLQQFRAVMRKNYVLQRRNTRDLVREVLWPIVLLAVLLIIKHSVKDQDYPNPQLSHTPRPIADTLSETGASPTTVLFAPCTDGTPSAVATVRDEFASLFGADVACVASGDDVDATYLEHPDTTFAAVVFNSPSTLGDASASVDYSLSLDVDDYLGSLGDNVTSSWHTAPDKSGEAFDGYFLPLQHAVEQAVVSVRSGGALTFSLAIQQFPTMPYSTNYATQALKGVLPIYLLLIFSIQIRVLLTRVLEEKEKKIKEGMRMMGLDDGVFWTSWFCTALIKNGFVTLVIVLVTKFGGLFPSSGFLIVFLFFFLFLFTCIAFAFLMTTLFSSARTGGAVGMLGFLVLTTPGYAIVGTSTSKGALAACSLLSPLAFNFGATLLNDAESDETGITWSNVSDITSDDLNIDMGTVLGMMVVCTVWMSVLTWYLDKVVPNEYGTTLKPLFCCTRSYWTGRSKEPESSRLLDADAVAAEAGVVASEAVSPEVSARPCVELQNLTKVFPSETGPKTAVDNLRLKMYEGTVTALLGHNGAGKTTTVSMLTGLFSPTSGDARVFGTSLVENLATVRRSIGVCPQHDILFEKLTVKEHLELYAGLKGIRRGHAMDAAVSELISDVGLQEKRDAWAGALSGGQKRRLSVAIALVGDPKVVFLDECTSGLDPGARRQIWNLIERKKAGRVIVLTTHFMDEADLLGDRIAIMARGRLRVIGSSLFLKSRFGIGYHLVMTTQDSTDVEATISLVREHVPTARVEHAEVAGTQDRTLSLLLPLDAVSSFGALFEALEASQSSLGIVDYGIAVTSLEEVFMRLAEKVEQEEAAAKAAAPTDGASGDPRARNASIDIDITDLGRDLGVAGVPAVRGSTAGLEPGTGAASAGAGAGTGAGHVEAEAKADGGFTRFDVETGPEVETRSHRSSSSSVAALKDRFTALLSSVSLAGSSRASVWKQTKTQFWRRLRQARRDKRGLWLQCVLPLVFVAISVAFEGLKNVDQTTALVSFPLTSAAFLDDDHAHSLPFAVSSSELADTVAAAPAFVPYVTNAMAPPTFPTDLSGMPQPLELNATSWTSFESQLYYDHKYSAGAFVFEPAAAGSNTSFLLTIMHNTSFAYATPTLLSAFDSAALRMASPGDSPAFSVSFNPFPRAPGSKKHSVGEFLSSALMGYYIALGFACIPALMASNVVAERENKSKQLQLIMGMSTSSYWMSTWAWDFIQYCVPWAGASILVAALGPDSYRTNFAALFVLLGAYGLSIPGVTYVLSFLFKKAAMAQTAIVALYTLLTTVLFFASFLLDFPTLGIPAAAGEAVMYIAMLLPNYALAQGFSDVSLKGVCPENVDNCSVPNQFSWDLAGAKLLYMLLSVPLWFMVLQVLEHYLAPSSSGDNFGTYRDRTAHTVVTEDDDVTREAERVAQGNTTDNVVANQLRKVYKSEPKPKVAVNNMSFGAAPGECLGILGPNGAGKTTTLQILTGDLAPSSGSAVLCGADIVQDRKVVYSNMGYCPQFDALFDLLTGEEVLTFYGRIKGIPDDILQSLVDASIAKMDLQRYRDQLTKTYSGGNKRKLSLAVAYIGAPRVVFLDEPSTGMDPMARRAMWGVVDAMRPGRTVILTTHLMEEADALCSRIGIMVAGRLACIGTSQHLKSKYGAGYQIEARTSNPAKVEHLKQLVLSLSPTAVLDEEHSGHVKYTVAQNLSLSAVFRAMEERKEELEVVDYAVSQTTLEQVFLRFSRMQAEVEAREANAVKPM